MTDIFTPEELTAIAHEAFGGGHTVEKDGTRYTFEIDHDDRSTMEYVNDMDALGRLAWPVRNRETGRDERPRDFTGAAIKFGPTQMHDTIWWEPYRDGKTVYASDEERAFMRDLLDWGTVCLSVRVSSKCKCCSHWSGDTQYLGGIESPLVASGNWDYLGECFGEMIDEATAE